MICVTTVIQKELLMLFDRKNNKVYNKKRGKNMDKDLLLELFRIPSLSGHEDRVASFIKNYFDNMGIKYDEDHYGNIYNLDDKNLPILNAHMDTVQDKIDEKLAKFVKIRDGILNGYGVIGGDDKCGLFVILKVLEKRKVNFIITREEEIGCVGISHFMNENKIKEYPWALTLDRYGSGDIICERNDYGTKEFEDALHQVGRSFGYNPAQGVYSDADYISQDVSCANVSVGYYAHHTKNEYVVLSELQNSINFVISAIDNIKEKFQAPQKFSYGKGYSYNSYDDPMDDFFLEEYNDYRSSDSKCVITGKKSSKLVYIPSLNDFISPEGAKKLFEDLEQTGILYDDYDAYDAYDDSDIDELIKGVI